MPKAFSVRYQSPILRPFSHEKVALFRGSVVWIGVLWLDGFPFSRCKSQGFFKSSSQQSKQPANGYIKLGSTSWKSPKPSPKEYLTTPPPFWGRLGLHVPETPCLGDGTVASRPDGLGGGGGQVNSLAEQTHGQSLLVTWKSSHHCGQDFERKNSQSRAQESLRDRLWTEQLNTCTR